VRGIRLFRFRKHVRGGAGKPVATAAGGKASKGKGQEGMEGKAKSRNFDRGSCETFEVVRDG